jgi:catechol 2,3-dioxygenase-like lactoylglutathione lyase family enzyme
MKFGLVVADASAAMTFYQETLGLEPLPSVGFMPDKIQMDVAGSPGLYQKLVGTFPKTGFQIEFLEFRGVTSKPIHPGVHDAGAPILRLRSRDIDLLSQHLKTAGFSMVSLSGAVSDQGNTRLIMARDPNNLFIQFVQPTRGAAR